MRVLWLTAGLLLTALGVIGALLPILPTTIFLILAAGCFTRSSPTLERWLLEHPQLGPPIRDWRETGSISRNGKRAAYTGLLLSYLILLISQAVPTIVLILIAAVFASIAYWIALRPDPAH